MSKKTTDIVAYLSAIGLVLAYIFGDREKSRFHLNQSLVLVLANILLGIVRKVLGWIPLIGRLAGWICGLLGLVLIIFWIIGFASAISGTEKKVPILGEIELLK